MLDPSVRDAIRAYVAERDWAQFHTPENLAKSIAIEAGELLECFQLFSGGDDCRSLSRNGGITDAEYVHRDR